MEERQNATEIEALRTHWIRFPSWTSGVRISSPACPEPVEGLRRQEMTPVASWRLCLPTPPTSKRYETVPFWPSSCHALTTATCTASLGLPSGTKTVTCAPREHRVGHRKSPPNRRQNHLPLSSQVMLSRSDALLFQGTTGRAIGAYDRLQSPRVTSMLREAIARSVGGPGAGLRQPSHRRCDGLVSRPGRRPP